MRLLSRIVVPALLAMACCASLAAAAVLDTPSVQLVNAGRASVRVTVAAGASGAPEGFRMQWMPASQYDAFGWPEMTDGRVAQGDFTGTPTLNTQDGTQQFKLLSRESAGVQIGDLFDETGITTAGLTDLNELFANTDYVVRVQAIGTANDVSSAWSAPLRVTTSTVQNCTFTQGYWKTHPNSWPVTSLTIGAITYTKSQLLQIFNQPAQGNGLVSLAHQLIAAKLNLAQGASSTPAVAAAIAAADAAIGSLICPPIGTGSLAPGATDAWTSTLDDYNNGITGPGHCGTTPTKTPTWGQLKLNYR